MKGCLKTCDRTQSRTEVLFRDERLAELQLSFIVPEAAESFGAGNRMLLSLIFPFIAVYCDLGEPSVANRWTKRPRRNRNQLLRRLSCCSRIHHCVSDKGDLINGQAGRVYEKYAAVTMLMTSLRYTYDSAAYYRARYYVTILPQRCTTR